MILAKLLLWMAQLSIVEIHSSGYRIDGLVQERRNSIANAMTYIVNTITTENPMVVEG